jgi:Arrestin (or S-antigen), C-terminal domain
VCLPGYVRLIVNVHLSVCVCVCIAIALLYPAAVQFYSLMYANPPPRLSLIVSLTLHSTVQVMLDRHIPCSIASLQECGKEVRKEFLFATGKVSAVVTIPRSAYARGETAIPIQVSVQNNSSNAVTSISAQHTGMKVPRLENNTKNVHRFSGSTVSWNTAIEPGSVFNVTLHLDLRDKMVSVRTQPLRVDHFISVSLSYTLPAVASTVEFPIVVREPAHHEALTRRVLSSAR